MAAAAYQVLLARHPEQAPAEADRLFREALRAEAPGPAVDNAIGLGASIGLAGVARYAAPTSLPQPFPVAFEPGRWRPTPPFLQISLVGDDKPLLFGAVAEAELRGPPPPGLGEERYRADVEEVRRLGGAVSAERTEAQREAAYFWAYQSSQRGFVHLSAALMTERPLPGGAWAEARAMSQLTAALADSFVMTWEEKRHFAFWRPVTAINEGSEGVVADPRWEAMIPTPPHPDYPSGHSADCSTGARVLEGVFGAPAAPFEYPAVDAEPAASRRFASFADAAQECGESRIWAGAHFRFAAMEGLRIGTVVAAKALKSVPPLGGEGAAPGSGASSSQRRAGDGGGGTASGR
jgi:PAP2 superfamily